MGGALFACSYLNDITGLMAGNIFPKMRADRYFTVLPDGHNYTYRMGVDLAFSEKERADYTARVTTAQDEEGNFYVLSAYRDKRETHHSEFVVDGWRAYPNIDLILMEKNQGQSLAIQELMRDYPRLPVEGKQTDTDKTTRARAVAAKYEAHKVWHHVDLRDTDFEKELLGFPKGHDDWVDALGFSMDLAGSGFFYGSLRR
jgi:predicted phage terminase large subunit-like protein